MDQQKCTTMRGSHHHRGCGCQHLFRKLLSKCGCCFVKARAESYSVAGSDGSITPSVGSVPHQASGGSSPCSHSSSGGSRHPVTTLKKWLTNPVRKLSSDARSGAGKGEKQMFGSDGRQPMLILSHTETQQRPMEVHNNYTILTSGDTECKDGLLNPAAHSPLHPASPSYLSDLLQGREAQSLVMMLRLTCLYTPINATDSKPLSISAVKHHK